MKCKEVNKYLSLIVDGEMEPSQALEFENHFETCKSCKALYQFEKAFKTELWRKTRQVETPPHLRENIRIKLSRADKVYWIKAYSARIAVTSMLFIAVTFFAFNYNRIFNKNSSNQDTMEQGMIQDLVTWHQKEYPVEVQGPNVEQVSNWFSNKLEFPVHAPSFSYVNASLVGGRLSSVHPYHAAYLIYRIGGKKVSLTIFRPNLLSVRGMRKIRLYDKNLYYTSYGRTNVVVWKEGNTAYALSSELPSAELLSLVQFLRR